MELGSVNLKRIGFFFFPIKHSTHTGNYAMAEPNSVLVLNVNQHCADFTLSTNTEFDNVNQHWSPVAMALIRARGTEIIFLPPYSLPPYSPEVGPLSRMSAVVCN